MSNDTKFPYANSHFEIISTFAEDEVMPWIKRCMADFPEKIHYDENGRNIYSTSLIDWWKKKWFGQFKEEPDKPIGGPSSA